MQFIFSPQELTCLSIQESKLFNKFASDSTASFFYAQELTLGDFVYKVKFIRRVKTKKQFQSKIVKMTELPQHQHIRQKGMGNYLWMWRVVSEKPVVVKKITGVSNYPLNVGSSLEGLTVLKADDLPLTGEELEFNNILRKILANRELAAYHENPISHAYVRVPTHTMPKRDADSYIPKDSIVRRERVFHEDYYLIKPDNRNRTFHNSMVELKDSHWTQLKNKNFNNSGIGYVNEEGGWQESRKITVGDISYGGMF